MSDIAIRFAVADDAPTILAFIRELAEYEKLLHEVVADEAAIRATLFGPRPAARGKGVGLALMAALARISVERDYGRFEWSVLDWNEPSLKFYASLGQRGERCPRPIGSR